MTLTILIMQFLECLPHIISVKQLIHGGMRQMHTFTLKRSFGVFNNRFLSNICDLIWHGIRKRKINLWLGQQSWECTLTWIKKCAFPHQRNFEHKVCACVCICVSNLQSLVTTCPAHQRRRVRFGTHGQTNRLTSSVLARARSYSL